MVASAEIYAESCAGRDFHSTEGPEIRETAVERRKGACDDLEYFPQ